MAIFFALWLHNFLFLKIYKYQLDLDFGLEL